MGEWSPVEEGAPVQKGIPGSTPKPSVLELPDSEGKLLKRDELPVPGVHYVEWEGALWSCQKSPHLTEEQYVDMECEETRNWVMKFDVEDKVLSSGKYVDIDPAERLSKAVQYARWRYRGYVAGQVAGL